ncbi:hypothetical protein ACFYX0_38565, partial [Streptomyces sp. NPDC002573]
MAGNEATQRAAQARIAAARTARAKAKAAQAAHARQAAQIAEKVFAPGARPFTPDSQRERTLGHRAPSPVTGTRPPTPSEKAAAGHLARALRAAAYRERTVTVTASAVPPGRLNMRGALARDAQKAAGALPTAQPWIRTQRRQGPTPPLRVGIAVDVSGSMRAAAHPIASAAWILAKAAALTGPGLAYRDHRLPPLHHRDHRPRAGPDAGDRVRRGRRRPQPRRGHRRPDRRTGPHHTRRRPPALTSQDGNTSVADDDALAGQGFETDTYTSATA